jgi:hypothetical protein
MFMYGMRDATRGSTTGILVAWKLHQADAAGEIRAVRTATRCGTDRTQSREQTERVETKVWRLREMAMMAESIGEAGLVGWASHEKAQGRAPLNYMRYIWSRWKSALGIQCAK